MEYRISTYCTALLIYIEIGIPPSAPKDNCVVAISPRARHDFCEEDEFIHSLSLVSFLKPYNLNETEALDSIPLDCESIWTTNALCTNIL